MKNNDLASAGNNNEHFTNEEMVSLVTLASPIRHHKMEPRVVNHRLSPVGIGVRITDPLGISFAYLVICFMSLLGNVLEERSEAKGEGATGDQQQCQWVVLQK